MLGKGRGPPLKVLEEMRAWGDRSGCLLGHISHREITWVIKSWRELSFAVCVSGRTHQEKRWLNNPTQASTAMVIAQLTTAKQTSLTLSPPLCLHLYPCFPFPHLPVPIMSPWAFKYTQLSITCVTFLLVRLVIDITSMESKRGSSGLKQTTPRSVPVV